MAQELLPAEVSITNWEISESAACLLQLEHVYSSTCRANSSKHGANVINNSYSFDEYTWIFIRIKKDISVTQGLCFFSTNSQVLATQFSGLYKFSKK